MFQINFQDKTCLQSYAICTIFNSLLLDGFFLIWLKLFYHPTPLKQHWVREVSGQAVKGWQMYKGKFLNMLEMKPIKPPNLVISVSSLSVEFIIQMVQYFQDALELVP